MSNCWNCGAPVSNHSPKCPHCHKNMIIKNSNKQDCVLIDHDSENKTLFLRWGDKYHTSVDGKNYVLDLNEYGDIIGIELLHFDGSKEYNMEYIE